MDEGIDSRFVCAVCCEVFKKPIVIRTCQHRFCEECMRRAPCKDDGALTCPMCRAPFHLDISGCYYDRELELEIARTVTVCSGCKQQCYLVHFDSHTVTCSKHNSQHLTHQTRPAATSQPAVPVQNRSTFDCPLCSKTKLDCTSLREHVNSLHATSTTPAVCPVCASMPWGDPNYTSQNFVQHLNLRHKFEYDTFVDYEQDDEVALKAVLEASQLER